MTQLAPSGAPELMQMPPAYSAPGVLDHRLIYPSTDVPIGRTSLPVIGTTQFTEIS